MMSLSNEFEQLKKGLKDKWLDYYKANQDWIFPILEENSDWVKVGGNKYRPPNYMILGVITQIEPKLAEWITLILKFQTHPYQIIEILELDICPYKLIDQLAEEQGKQQFINKRFTYLFWIYNKHQNIKISKLLSLNFIPNVNLEQNIQLLNNIQQFLGELYEFQNSDIVPIFSEPSIDPDTEYLNQIREQIAREKEKENANL